MGCLKLDCTFVHLRSRPNSRNSSTPRRKKYFELVVEFLFDSLLASTTNLVNKEVTKPPSPVINPPPSTVNELVPTPPPPPPPPVPKIEIPSPAEPVIQRISPPAESPEKKSDDTKAPTRTIVNRNVVVAESSRKVVQGTIPNRVVVSSDSIKSSKKPSNDSDSDLDDLIEQENETSKSNEYNNQF